MRADEAESRLCEMLTAARVSPNGAEQHDPRRAWETFKTFAAEPVDEAADDPDRDMLIYESGQAELDNGQRCFSFVLRRQLVFHDSSGEYDHMEDLMCGLWCDLTPELEQLEFEEGHFFPVRTYLDQWVTDVERSAGFAALMNASACWVFTEQGRI